MKKFIAFCLSLFLLLIAVGVGAALYILQKYGQGLPDYASLAEYEPPIVSRIHSGDGRVMLELANERRVFVPVDKIPPLVKNAFISAEDKNFYQHQGVDPMSVMRAIITNVQNMGSNRRPVGASTITQQVAKNFLLTNEVSIDRKIKEAILAFRIERALSKDRILELYLNEIYLGARAYGVSAAALRYFDKSLDELTLEEAAYLAALPKAPNNYNPENNYNAAVARRNWVIRRMLEDGHVSMAQASLALETPLQTYRSTVTNYTDAPDFAEEVRRWLLATYGEETVYGGGLSVRSTIDPHLQRLGQDALRRGLLDYDKRHGWRGAAQKNVSEENFATLPNLFSSMGWQLARAETVNRDFAVMRTQTGDTGRILLGTIRWARPALRDGYVGKAVEQMRDVFDVGDVVYIRRHPTRKDEFTLEQPPAVDGALVALDPHTGRVLSMVGGFNYASSQFNRATQAKRQPGSTFKPFVYLAALEHGYSPTTLIMDAPIVIDQGGNLGQWRPSNYTQRFYGLSTMRLGMEKSRNLMTVRIAQALGMDKVLHVANRFGVGERVQPVLSSALGSGEVTLLELTSAYAQFVNGGKRIKPSLVDKIHDRYGRITYRHDTRECKACKDVVWEQQPIPIIPDNRPRVTDSGSAYQMVSMLEGAVARGTGQRIAQAIPKPLAGKTGTTNNSRDTWFVGFSPDLAVGVFVGFDEPRTLGRNETGGSVAAPIFAYFMAEALKDQPAIPFRVPPDIALVRVNAETGQAARPTDTNVILEAFKRDQPIQQQQIFDARRGDDASNSGRLDDDSTGGIY